MKPKVPQELFKNESVATPSHDEMLILYSKDSELLNKIINKITPQLRKVPTQHIHKLKDKSFCMESEQFCKDKIDTTSVLVREKKIFIEKWEPEKPLHNGQYKHYIGSVDLFVNYSICYNLEYLYTIKEKKSVIKHTICKKYSILFEFKPQIKSFSEVIRQIKVYENYFENIYSIVVTYSDISKFKSIFESQGIELIQLKKEYNIKKDDSQTNLG